MERIRWSLPIHGAHPSAHGGLLLDLAIDDGVVVAAEAVPGRLHRGAEKLSESRDYRALLALANRHDWFGSVASELSLATLIESFLGLEVPTRAAWLRTLLAEYTRMAHHLLWLTSTVEALARHGQDRPAGAVPQATAAGHAARERIVDALESYTGARMHPTVVVVGGVRLDYTPEWLRAVEDTLAPAVNAAARVHQLATQATPELRGLAVLPAAAAWDYSASGPLARASGVELDLRLDRPDATYARLGATGALRRVVAQEGDALARLGVLAGQVEVSAACVAACVEQLRQADPASPIDVALPRSIRLPEGHGYAEVENPAGINGWYLVSQGGTHPYRLKLRTASYNHAQTLSVALPGTPLEHLPAAIYSYFLVAGDIDK